MSRYFVLNLLCVVGYKQNQRRSYKTIKKCQ